LGFGGFGFWVVVGVQGIRCRASAQAGSVVALNQMIALPSCRKREAWAVWGVEGGGFEFRVFRKGRKVSPVGARVWESRGFWEQRFVMPLVAAAGYCIGLRTMLVAPSSAPVS
jgi:hypothetical protein